MSILIKNGRVIDPHNDIDEIKDVYIDESGKICDHVADAIVIDASGLWVVPGLVDLHAHFRDPGLTHKEDLHTGALAAVRGGFTTVCIMPNTLPSLDFFELIKDICTRSAQIGLAQIIPIASITTGMKGEQLTDFADLKEAGAIAFSEDGLTVKNAGLMMQAFEKAQELDMPIFTHCEDVSIMQGGVMNSGKTAEKLGLAGIHPATEDVIVARDIILAEHTGARVHICHVSTAGAVQAVREAKARRVLVTAEVCPHHFILCDEDITAADSNFKMNPPLRSPADVEAIKEGLRDGTIDAIATDHAPHTESEKARPFSEAPFGIVGLETALPLAMELIDEGIMSPSGLLELLSLGPSEILGIDRGHLSKGALANIAIIDPLARYNINPANFASKSKNTPFAGRSVKGKVVLTIVDGRIVYDNRQAD